MHVQEVSFLQLHGTGTPLGDPIEVGAAVVALRPAGTHASAQPLSLAACKTAVGHTEPAAGVLGAVHALLELATQEARPLLHLRQVSLFVEVLPQSPSHMHACMLLD